jgi:hypothetical protein
MLPQVAKYFLPRKFMRETMINVGIDEPIAENAYPI